MAEHPDILNEAAIKTAEIAFLAAQQFLARLPNPVGQVREPSQVMLKDIKRMLER